MIAGKSKIIALIAVFIIAIGIIGIAAGNMSGRIDEHSAERLEDAVRQISVAHYAITGTYPDSVDYMVEHYGLRPDPRFEIHYNIFGANIPPEIIITEKGTAGVS